MTGIFRAYDVRGQYPEELDERTAEKIGAAFAQVMKFGTIAVGQDIRPSSPALAGSFIRGYTGAGGSVTDFGLTSTPLLYYAIIEGAFDGGAMITASHLPAQENGFKLCREKAIPLSGDKGLPELQRIAAGMPDVLRPAGPARHGPYQKGDMTQRYIQAIASRVCHDGSLTIATDAGDGMAGPELRQFFSACPALNAVPLHSEPDGRFPHHGANPFVSSATAGLQEAVRSSHADFGVAFDGDADRCIFVDEQGERVPPDLITALVAGSYLSRYPGAAILYDLRSSRVVPETITRLGGRAIRSRVGHAFIKEQMRREDALFAGELSGHYYFRDMGYCDNGIFAMVQVINLLAGNDRPLSRHIAPLRKYSATGEVNIRVSREEPILTALLAAYSDAAIDHLDGMTVTYDSWWFNLRSSNTEPVLRLNLEADTRGSMEKKKAEVLKIIGDADPEMQIEAG